MNFLKNEGEGISQEELDQYMQLLVGDESSKALKQIINADEFAENILGFEEVEEGEEEENLADNAPNGSQF